MSYFLDMHVVHYADVADARPYHAALGVIEPYGHWLAHTHADFHEVLYVVQGRGWQQLGEYRQELAEGDLTLVRPRDVHSFTASKGHLHFVNVAFPSERWQSFLRYAGVTAGEAWDQAEYPLVVHDVRGTVAKPVIHALEAFQRDGSALDIIRLWTAAIPLLESAGAGSDDFRPTWLVDVCEAMLAEENLRAGLPRMLQLARVSQGHLARSMAKHYGSTPVDFVNGSRLAHAAVLLATSTEPVGRIAERCGFTSQSYFGRRFRERYLQTPREYRDRARRAVIPQRAPS